MKRAAWAALALALAAALWSSGRGASGPGLARAELVPLADRSAAPEAVRLLTVTQGAARFEYRRTERGWWCLSPIAAPAHGERIEALLGALGSARGLVRAEGEDASFGLGPGRGVRLAGRGADGGALFALELGDAPAGAGRAFVSAERDGRVLEIPLASEWLPRRAAEEQAPWLDRRLLAGTGFDAREGIRRAFVDLSDGRGLELRPGPEVRGAEGWELVVAGAGSAALPFRLVGWLTFLVRAPYERLLLPTERVTAGLDEPVATVTLVPREGEALVLAIGRPVVGGVAAEVRGLGFALVLDPEQVALVAPSPGMLRDPDRPNPWEAWLRR